MKKRHGHADAIERIGYKAIIAHFNISRQSIHKWKVNGVPERHIKTLSMLGAVAGHDVSELKD